MVARLIIQTALWLAGMAALLFMPAGTLEWPGAWVFLAEMGASGLAIGFWLARHDPQLLAERLSPLVQREQKAWDKILMVAVVLLWSGWLVVMALDAARYRSSHVPLWAQGVGALGIFVSIYIAYLV